MIYIKLAGGLGNQLFEIFACISCAIDRNLDYRISDIFYDTDQKKCTKRHTYWENILDQLKINNKIIKEFDLSKYKRFNSNRREYKKIIDGDNIHLFGYFQSYKYFEKNYNKIIDILKIREKQDIINKKYDYDYDNICSIHFRYGDYKNKKKYHINLDANYFKKAVGMIDSTKYLLFYEQEDIKLIEYIINEIKKELKDKSDKVEFLTIDTSIPDHEQILIMSLCKNNIIANSTFSWFAACFNQNEDKKIIQPSRVIYKEKDLQDLSPKNDKRWITIKV